LHRWPHAPRADCFTRSAKPTFAGEAAIQITNHGVANAAPPVQLQVDEIAAAIVDQPVRSATVGDNSYTPSPELVQLIHDLCQQPEIRDERVQAATARLRQGDYHTAAAAAQAAAALLKELD
jgi:hypothetical protein